MEHVSPEELFRTSKGCRMAYGREDVHLGQKFRVVRNPNAVRWYLLFHLGDLHRDLKDKRFTGTRGEAESPSESLIPSGVYPDIKKSSQEELVQWVFSKVASDIELACAKGWRYLQI